MRLKNANLDQIITLETFCAQFVPQKCVETPIFIVFWAISVLETKTILDQMITLENPNLDQIITPQHKCIYIYIHVCVVKLLFGPSLALSGVIIWSE